MRHFHTDQTLEQVGSPHIVFRGVQSTATRTFRGAPAAVLSLVPDEGQSMPDMPVAGFKVFYSEYKTIRGGLSELIINLRMSDGFQADPEEHAQQEIEWSMVERHIATNRYFAVPAPGDPPPGGAFPAMTANDHVNVRLWEGLSTNEAERRRAFEYPLHNNADPETSDHWRALDGRALEMAQMLSDGQDTWWNYVPIVRRTTKTLSPQISEPCGMVDVPPQPYVAGYVYLRTADRSARDVSTGLWIRLREWTGARAWNSKLYS